MTPQRTPSSAAVVGTGYVGLVTGACLAAAGARVTCHDVAASRIQALKDGNVPIHEPGLDGVVADAVGAGLLTFTTDLAQALEGAHVVFLAVGTPPREDGSADLGALWSAADDVARSAGEDTIVVIRSTVPPGTGDRLQQRLGGAGRPDLVIVNAPEFLAEGTAVRDFQEPARLVFGGPPDATAQVAALWAPIRPEAPRVHTSRATAELAKYAANTFLAARVSLINEMANLCASVGADVRDLARIVGLDDRIGARFLRAGIGYGGSCFPKDVQALGAFARARDVAVPVTDAVEATNEKQWRRALDHCLELLEGEAAGKTVAVWGIAFKPGTDDTRSAPAVRIAAGLADAGAQVRMHDPVATLPGGLPAGVQQVAEAEQAVQGAHLAVHATEWPAYADLDWGAVAQAMARPVLFDGRNALPWAELQAAGIHVTGVGAAAGGTP